jgi:hypothetical protein
MDQKKIDEIKEWLASEAGRLEIRLWQEKADREIAALKKARQVDWRTLNEPMTI